MSDIEFFVSDHIAYVRLNRPKALNSITPEMDNRLAEIWDQVNADRDIWCVILSAEGEKAFCAGADISGGAEMKQRMALGGGLTGIGGPLVKLKKPLIAAVQGYCLGGGFEIAMCADIIVAADTTQFGLPETRVGIIGECGVVHRAVRQLPHHIAMAMILTGERMKATELAQYGLVNEVVPFAGLQDAAQAWAKKVTACSPLAVQAAKEAALARVSDPLDVALATKFEAIEAYAATNDVKEGMAAFSQKRKPAWTAS